MSNFIDRKIAPAILEAAKYYSVIIITGPRQTGKTTLAKHLWPDYSFTNLEDASTRARANDDINTFLDTLGNSAIIDEVQRVPEILSAIQARVDANPSLHYILTGSNNFSLLHSSMQSLAGRAALFTLLPFSFEELNDRQLNIPTAELMQRGFYPGTIANGVPPRMFYKNYYSTYIERDIRGMAQIQLLDRFQRFIKLCAGRCGTEINRAAIGTEAGVSAPTVDNWISLLKASYIVYTLPPYFANINKRLTKSNKLYFYDTGLLCFLLGIEEWSQLENHPLRGSIFENLVVSEFMKNRFNADKQPNLYFYRERTGKEIDIVQEMPDGLHLYEVKASKTFQSTFTSNMKYLEQLLPDVVASTVIYDGDAAPPGLLNIRNI
ncbi:MAG: ATP-binding protein [Muribaculaceae bacterium]|nr:ATP-binding protein [Bacteroides sp.]MBD5328172.1 ATP-binding protein [Bacteroides sp.]MDE6817826.1 ATP-binding protein [Muribaculaceae bacterium]